MRDEKPERDFLKGFLSAFHPSSFILHPFLTTCGLTDNIMAFRAQVRAQVAVVLAFLFFFVGWEADSDASGGEGEDEVFARFRVYIDGCAVDGGGRQNADLARPRREGNRFCIGERREADSGTGATRGQTPPSATTSRSFLSASRR